jgi:hypothetical protein
MCRFTCAFGMASLAILTSTGHAQSPTSLYTASVASSGPVAIATTPGTLLNPRSAYVVAATQGAEGLRVTAWQDTTHKLQLLGHFDEVGYDLVQVAATGLDPTHVVTAEIGTAGNLALQVFGIGSAGPTGPVASIFGTANTATTVGRPPYLVITSLNASQVVTAYCNEKGNLAIQAWTVDVNAGTITALGAAAAGNQVDEIAMAQLDGATVVTAAGTPDGSLIVTSWGVDGGGVHYQDQYVAKNASQSLDQGIGVGAVDVLSINPPGVYPFEKITRRALTTSINAVGVLEVLEWEISSAGNLSLQKKSVGASGDFVFATAATMLPTGIPISVESDVNACVSVGWYELGADADFAATSGSVLSGVTSLAATTAGTDAIAPDPAWTVHAYFATGTLIYSNGTPNDGTLEIRMWSYPIEPALR